MHADLSVCHFWLDVKIHLLANAHGPQKMRLDGPPVAQHCFLFVRTVSPSKGMKLQTDMILEIAIRIGVESKGLEF